MNFVAEKKKYTQHKIEIDLKQNKYSDLFL